MRRGKCAVTTWPTSSPPPGAAPPPPRLPRRAQPLGELFGARTVERRIDQRGKPAAMRANLAVHGVDLGDQLVEVEMAAAGEAVEHHGARIADHEWS